MNGGAPALRDAALLEPEMTVERVDGFILSGGSAFGLDAAGGAMAFLASIGRGYPIARDPRPDRPRRKPVRPPERRRQGLGPEAPYWEFGFQPRPTPPGPARLRARKGGRRLRRHTYDLKSGLGSTSAVTSRGFRVGALVACNSGGRATRGLTQHFWAAPYERAGEFGGRGFGRGKRALLDTCG